MADKKDAALKTATSAGEEIAIILEDRTTTVKDLLKAVPHLKVATAWAAGDIEFGCRAHVVNGQPGKPGDSQLIVECGWNWTGPKKVGTHVGFRDLWASYQKPLPECKFYREYPETVPVDHPPEKSPLRDITRAQAEEMLTLQVRLTDKGLSLLMGDTPG